MKNKVISLVLALVMAFVCIPFNAFAITHPTADISVENVFAAVGDTVDVNVTIANNPGIIGATLTVSYHEDLTLVGVSSGDAFSALDFTKPGAFKSPCNFTWDSENTEADKDGIVLTLTFEVSAEAEKNSKLNVDVSYRFGDVFNDTDDIELNITNGKVDVLDYKPGDVFEDGVLNMKDVRTLRQYIAGGYDITINEAAADVNGDGVINAKDTRMLRRHIVGGYDDAERLLPSPLRCKHPNMEAVAEKAVTCTEDGNKAYWYCADCERYFSDENATTEVEREDVFVESKGHTMVVIPGKEPDYGVTGLSDGLQCESCGYWEIEQIEIPALTLNEYSIKYEIAGTDTYLEELEKQGKIENTNPDRYTSQQGIDKINDLSVAGYNFLGWYDTAEGGNRITAIEIGTSGEQTLYAHWSKAEYTITFDSPDYEKESIKYTVDTGASLGKEPSIPGYTFIGWSNNDGFIVSSTIPVGTTGNITLHANWTSNRNKAVSYETYSDPIIITDEEDQQIIFVYDIGRIENVPLTKVSDTINVIAGNTYKVDETYEYTDTISSEDAKSVANSIANATTRSSGWTLSKEWNDFYSAGIETGTQQIKSEERTDSTGKVVGGEYFVSNSEGGSSFVSTESGSSSSSSAKVTTDTSKGINYSYDTKTETYADAKLSVTNETELSAGVSAGYGPFKAEAGVKNTTTVGAEASSGRKDETSTHFDGSASSYVGTVNTSESSAYYNVSTNNSSNWNSTNSYTNSEKYSEDTEISTGIVEQIQESTNYNIGKSLSETGTQEVSVQGQETTESAYTTNFKYYQGTSTKKTVSKSETLSTPGNYRYVLAGTVHVYGVVGYDIATGSYYTYTYSVLADETEVWRDFSKDTTSFDDCENGVVTFKVPYEINEYVLSMTAASHGIVFDKGTVDSIELTDDYDGNIVIPQYHSEKNAVSGTYTSYKTTGFNASFLQDAESDSDEIKEMKAYIRSTVETIILPPSVTEIPDGAFKDCTALKNVMAFGVTSIGKEAFAGCINLGRINENTVDEFSVDNLVTYLGDDAFKDVPSVSVMAANAQVVDAVISSGAKSIKVNMKYVADGTYDNKLIDIPDGTESFTLIGNGKTFKNLQVISKAKTTALGNITFVENVDTPLEISSSTITLAEVYVQNAPGFAMIMGAENTNVYLQGTNAFSSRSDNAVIGRNVSFAKADAGVTGKMQLTGNYAIFGNKTNGGMVQFEKGNWVELDEDGYGNLLKTITITFEANGGTLQDVDKTKAVTYKQQYGKLPTPSRTGYTFDGWFTEEAGGTRVNDDTTVEVLANHTLYAHWTAMAYTADWNIGTGYTITVNRTASPYANASVGVLESGATVYYGDELTIQYKADTGYTLTGNGATDVTVEGNLTSSDIYATAKVNSYTVSWNTGTGYTITVKRTSSPKAGAATGTLSNRATVYYGDVLAVTYTKADYYTITATGATSITVTRNITSSDIYATASLNPTYEVLESQVPAGAQDVSTRWTYTRTQTTESTSASIDGWTPTGSYWRQTGSESTKYASFPSGFDTSNSYYTSYAKSAYSEYDNGSTKREVTNTWSGYIYWHWMYNVAYSTGTGRTIADKKCEYDNKAFKYFYAIASTTDCPELTDRSYVANYAAGKAPVTYNCKSILPSSSSTTDGMGTPRMFRFSYYTSTYVDYEKVYQYQKITTGIESLTAVSEGGEISNVQKWVTYRAK